MRLTFYTWRFRCTLGILCITLLLPITGQAQTPASVAAPAKTPPTRPIILMNRWQENWSALANPQLPRAPLDSLKYIPLSLHDSASYISLGITVRERFETNDAPQFGVDNRNYGSEYLLQRLQMHADIHPNENWQIFIQLEDARAFWKADITPADQNPLDVEQAFVAYIHPINDGFLKLRVGRQEMGFDLQRFISIRNGPNVRQAFDAIWGDWESSQWRVISFWSEPVQYQDVGIFDDVANRHFQFGMFRIEDNKIGPGKLSGYVALYIRDNVNYLGASGNEQRNILDVHYAGAMSNVDWDFEAMGQTGHVGNSKVQAWAFGSIVGYTVPEVTWSPRFAIQFDAASGDHHPGDGFVQTFNPLFPNGYYFTLAGYTTYANLINLKPSVTIKPLASVTLLGAIGLQWRETVNDAIYTIPNNYVPGTAGKGSSWTGVYFQARADWKISSNLAAAVEAVHFQAGNAIRQAGGHNAEYCGVELDYGW
jgi:hypothetical protein